MTPNQKEAEEIANLIHADKDFQPAIKATILMALNEAEERGRNEAIAARSALRSMLNGDKDAVKLAKAVLDKDGKDVHEPVHIWFSLSYAAYLILPRLILQNMPVGWQRDFISLVDEIESTLGPLPSMKYSVQRRGNNGKFTKDPFANYRRGSLEEAKKCGKLF
jgi:hypothetical protein